MHVMKYSEPNLSDTSICMIWCFQSFSSGEVGRYYPGASDSAANHERALREPIRAWATSHEPCSKFEIWNSNFKLLRHFSNLKLLHRAGFIARRLRGRAWQRCATAGSSQELGSDRSSRSGSTRWTDGLWCSKALPRSVWTWIHRLASH